MESVPQSVSFELVPKFSANLPSLTPLDQRAWWRVVFLKGIFWKVFSGRYFEAIFYGDSSLIPLILGYF